MPNSTTILLRELQQWMRWVIVDPRGVEDALRDPNPCYPSHPDRYTEPKISARHLIDGSGQINAIERLSVYAEGYFLRIVESLEMDFPLTKKILGDELFSQLINNYIKEYPSQTPNIMDIGRFLPNFIATHAFQNDIFYLSDVINFEWHVNLAVYANDLPNLDINKLSHVSEDQWETAQIILDPSVRLFKCNWPVDVLWQNRENENFTTLKEKLCPESINLCLHRMQGKVFIERPTIAEFKVLNLLQAGCTLGEAILEINEEDANNLMVWFASWMKKGLIKQIRFL